MIITSTQNTVAHKPSIRDAIIMQGVEGTPIIEILGKGEKIGFIKTPKNNTQIIINNVTMSFTECALAGSNFENEFSYRTKKVAK